MNTRSLVYASALLIFGFRAPPAFCFDWFGDDGPEEAAVLEVVEPFIEMHTGPGRGYPVFHVIEQGETVQILKRKPDWYKVRSADNKEGWVKSAQLARTLEPTGVPADLPEVTHGDYLKSRWRAGFTAGQLESASTFSVTAGWQPFSRIGLEVEGGKIFDRSVTSEYYGGNLLVEPFPDWSLTPFLSVGAGRMLFASRQKVLVDDTGDPDYTRYGAGASWYVGRNFLVRAEYRFYSVSTDEGSRGLNAWAIGLNAFF